MALAVWVDRFVHHDAELVDFWIVRIDQFAPADGKILAGAPIYDLDLAP